LIKLRRNILRKLFILILILISLFCYCDNENNQQEHTEGSLYISNDIGETSEIKKYDVSNGELLLKFGEFYTPVLDTYEEDGSIWVADERGVYKHSPQGDGNILEICKLTRNMEKIIKVSSLDCLTVNNGK
jgi:hypothetical protein